MTAGVGRILLDVDRSAGLRDRLLTEIASLSSAEKAATWARGALEAKNRLTAADAKLVEEGFEVRMTCFVGALDGEGTPLASASAMIDETIVPDGETPKGVDKSALTFGEPRRHRDKAHLAYVSSLSCLVCGRRPSDPHHLALLSPARSVAR